MKNVRSNNKFALARLAFVIALVGLAVFSCGWGESGAVGQAQKLFAKGDFKSARLALDQAVLKYPKSKKLHYLHGQTLLKTGDLPGAVAAFGMCLHLDWNDYTGHQGIGDVLYLQTKWDAAEKEYRLALKNNPKSIELYRKLIDVLSRSGHPEAAKGVLEEAQRTMGNSGDLIVEKIAYYLQTQDLDGAQHEITNSPHPSFTDSAQKIRFLCLRGVIPIRKFHQQKQSAAPLTPAQLQTLRAAQQDLEACQKADPKNFEYNLDLSRVSALTETAP